MSFHVFSGHICTTGGQQCHFQFQLDRMRVIGLGPTNDFPA